MAVKNAFTSNTRKPETLFYFLPYEHVDIYLLIQGHLVTRFLVLGSSPYCGQKRLKQERTAILGEQVFFEKAASQVLLICTDM